MGKDEEGQEAAVGRSRRANAGRGRSSSAARSALEELRALKAEGGKGRRAATFEVKEVPTVYDVVDEKDYAEIVAKRRRDGGGFLEDDVGSGYADVGEEVDWTIEEGHDGEGRDESGERSSQPPKKLKGGDGKDSKKGKSRNMPEFDPEGRKRMQTLLMARSAVHKTSRPVTDEESDELLNDILSSLGGTSSEPTASANALARHRPAAPPSQGFSRVPNTISRPVMPAASVRPRASAVQGSSGKATISRTANYSRPAPTGLGIRSTSNRQHAASPEANAGEPAFDDFEFDTPAVPAPEDNEDADMPPATEAARELDMSAGDIETPGEADGAQDQEDMRAMLEDAAVEEEEDQEHPKAVKSRQIGKGAIVEEDGTAQAAAGWAELCNAEPGGDGWDDEAAAAAEDERKEDVAMASLDEAEEMPFFLLDIHEEYTQPGTVFLFGKVLQDSCHVSACCAVRDMIRTLFVVPKDGVLADSTGRLGELQELASQDPSKKRDLMIHLQQLAAALKMEVKETLAQHGITKTTISVVQRSYAFEEPGVQHGRQWVLKVKYLASQGQVPIGLKGQHYAAIFGGNTSLTEALLVKRRIMGPSWITLKNTRRVEKNTQLSWCAVELEASGPKSVVSGGEVANRDAPRLVVASLHIKTHFNHSSQANEVVSAGVVYLNNAKVDGPTQKQEWNSPKHLRHFSVLRKMDNNPWPIGFQTKVAAANESPVGRRNSQGGPMLSIQNGERALLAYLLARLQAIDADVFVGHNIAGFDIDVLLHRLQLHKVPHWSRIGRLKRNRFPNLSGGGNVFGGGASQGALTALCGRLLCDTYLAAREFVKEVDYTMSTLSKSLLGQERSELPGGSASKAFEGADSLMALVECTNSDAWLSLGLMFHLSVLPLTRQLACLSGFQWAKTLSGARAQRIEMLLLHEFHSRKFIVPDKLSNKEKAQVEKQRAGEDGGDKKGKGPQYAGGLVLEPKKGLYDKYVLMLDFNSLYPSIIQEYNICFTTVERPEDGAMAPLPQSTEELAPLPLVIKKLVQRRRQVKELIKREGDNLRKEQLNIRQQALKLTANSMYGCLGFSSSRFYCKPLAELITSQGREILQSTVDLVQQSMQLEVIYGDTDSIMINTATDNLPDVWKMGQGVKKEVNKRYRLLEIEVDGVYKSMLLLKKKKYAAIKVELLPSGEVKQEMEQKGLDIVRRDWCPLSKDCGNFALGQILSGSRQEDVVDAIHAHLQEVREKVASGQVPVNKFVITKQLTKQPEDYPDAKNQPHVQVALRRKAAGKRNGVAAGETVPYIICINQAVAGEEGAGEAAPVQKSLAERAYHPEELRSSDSLVVDAEYYLGQQVHPVVSRLCSPIEGTNPGHLAECLGLDSSRYRGAAMTKPGGVDMREELNMMASGSLLDDEDTYKDCEALALTSGSGADAIHFRLTASVLSDVASGAREASSVLRATPGTQPLSPAQISNQATLAARAAISAYYAAPARSDDEVAPHDSRDVCLRVLPGSSSSAIGCAPFDPDSAATMLRTVTEADLYTQLTAFHRALDIEGAARRARGDDKEVEAAGLRLSPLRQALEGAAAAVERFRSSCGYKWVDLAKLYSGNSSSLADEAAASIAEPAAA